MSEPSLKKLKTTSLPITVRSTPSILELAQDLECVICLQVPRLPMIHSVFPTPMVPDMPYYKQQPRSAPPCMARVCSNCWNKWRDICKNTDKAPTCPSCREENPTMLIDVAAANILSVYRYPCMECDTETDVEEHMHKFFCQCKNLFEATKFIPHVIENVKCQEKIGAFVESCKERWDAEDWLIVMIDLLLALENNTLSPRHYQIGVGGHMASLTGLLLMRVSQKSRRNITHAALWLEKESNNSKPVSVILLAGLRYKVAQILIKEHPTDMKMMCQALELMDKATVEKDWPATYFLALWSIEEYRDQIPDYLYGIPKLAHGIPKMKDILVSTLQSAATTSSSPPSASASLLALLPEINDKELFLFQVPHVGDPWGWDKKTIPRILSSMDYATRRVYKVLKRADSKDDQNVLQDGLQLLLVYAALLVKTCEEFEKRLASGYYGVQGKQRDKDLDKKICLQRGRDAIHYLRAAFDRSQDYQWRLWSAKLFLAVQSLDSGQSAVTQVGYYLNILADLADCVTHGDSDCHEAMALMKDVMSSMRRDTPVQDHLNYLTHIRFF